MRRTQTSRHHPRPSLAVSIDEQSMLRETDDASEDVLRRQLLDKDRECDRLQTQIQILQAQLAQRPPIDQVQELQKEYKNLDLLLQGTQRENERCMAELDRVKQREKMLEQALTRVAGENWQHLLDIPPVASSRMGHGRSNTISYSHAAPLATIPASPSTPTKTSRRSSSINTNADSNANTGKYTDRGQTLAHIEQVRMLVLGMEQRLQSREDKLAKSIERAEHEGRKFDGLRKELGATAD